MPTTTLAEPLLPENVGLERLLALKLTNDSASLRDFMKVLVVEVAMQMGFLEA
jgi:hypothetical protein